MAEPKWLFRAMDPSTPTTENNETVRTVDYEQDGKRYIAPTIRMVDGELKTYSVEEAIDLAIKNNDALEVPNGMDPSEFSKLISERIGTARGRRATNSAETSR
jgi:hypothetical protein